ncbi:MAG: GNAT family N-acetyltransferase [Desulfobacterales bacterium]
MNLDSEIHTHPRTAFMRIATESDLPRIVDIYNSTVSSRQSTADTEPVTVEQRLDWFRRHTAGRRPILVHETDGVVGAWVSFEPFYGRAAYRRTAEISIYIAPEHRGRGLGRAILGEAVAMAPGLEINTLLAYVFSHNQPSLRLFSALGFAEWGRLPGIAEMDGREYSLSILGLRTQV